LKIIFCQEARSALIKFLQLLGTAGRVRIRDIVVRVVELEAGTHTRAVQAAHNPSFLF